MQGNRLVASLVFLSFALVAGCGGSGSSVVTSSSGSAFLFIGDTPPPGSTILKFEINLTGAALCPQVGSMGECQGSPQPSLINQPVQIELDQLQLKSTLLNLASVPAGTYAGLKLTFANPELKLMLSDGTVQELKPPLNPAMVTPTFQGGLTVTANANFGFLIDFNVADSIQSSGNTVTGISPMVTLVILPAVAQQNIQELEDVTGKVSNLNKTCPTGSFTLIEAIIGLPIANIQFDSTTEFREGQSCAALANDQTVEADLVLREGQTVQSAQLFAKVIELVNPPNESEAQGLVFRVDSPNQFILLVGQEVNASNVALGSFLTVNVSGAQFRIDSDNLPVGSLSFASGNDLLAGQTVEVDIANNTLVVPAGGCGTIGNCTATAEKVRLKKGTVTGRVASTSTAGFTLDQLPSIFGSPSTRRLLSADCPSCFVGSVQVSTSSQTEFESPLTGVSGLAVGNIVSVRGLLFKDGFAGPSPGSGQPNLVAAKVRRRSP